jgi:hypothetical protein
MGSLFGDRTGSTSIPRTGEEASEYRNLSLNPPPSGLQPENCSFEDGDGAAGHGTIISEMESYSVYPIVQEKTYSIT